MKRRALLIGSPLSGKNHLNGVKWDVKNFYQYLTSAMGGGYFGSEIICLKEPNLYTLLLEIKKLCYCDIAIIYFSGHGFTCENESYICLNEKEYIKTVQLSVQLSRFAKRNIVITDSCRNPLQISQFIREDLGIGAVPPRFDDINLARKIYSFHVEKVPFGSAILCSTTNGHVSIDTEYGGLFTNTFLNEIDMLAKVKRTSKSLLDVFNMTRKTLISKRQNQIPQIYSTSREFCVKIPFFINHKLPVYYDLLYKYGIV